MTETEALLIGGAIVWLCALGAIIHEFINAGKRQNKRN
jgi:hypothetical protein